MNIGNFDFPLPHIDSETKPYWDALAQGRHVFQRCTSCSRARLPPRDQCPMCLSPEHTWEEASGKARLISWVVYHTAFHPAFKARLPYNVAVVELAEGPRLISNIVGVDDQESLRIEQPLMLKIESEHGVAVPRFRLA